ncbi:MAG: hypothetical protein PVF56_19085 [Desulfobacterales bacterium]|jgi:hypothetical protein
MQDIFRDILSIDGVKGVMVLSFTGDLVFEKFTSKIPRNSDNMNWSQFIAALGGMRETDLIFEKGRIYMRRTDIGYLLIFVGLFVPMAMLRLNCDILLPSLKPGKSNKRWSRLFKR